jgi:catechol 2,3-dioxygenase-like lactoylglutathione lyase family enzyme
MNDAPGPLTSAHVVTKLPAQDLDRARRFYGDVLGLEPVEERGAFFRDSEGNLLSIGQSTR